MNLSVRSKFSKTQYDRLSNIFDGAGQVIFGVTVVTPVIRGLDSSDLHVLSLGISFAVFCWIVSTMLAKKGRIVL